MWELSQVSLTVENGYALMVLNAPAQRNVLSAQMSREIISCIDRVESDPAIVGLIITGKGPAFSAGGDLGELLAVGRGESEGIDEIYSGFLAVANCTLPTIAAVNGPAVGAGMNLALACDVRLAAESALFDTRFLAIGIHPGGGHTWMLQRAVGWQEATAMLLLGQTVTGKQAVAKGLALECVPDRDLLPRAAELTAAMRHYPREVIVETKKSMRQSRWLVSHAEAVDLEYEAQYHSLRQPGAIAALTALYEKISGRN